MSPVSTLRSPSGPLYLPGRSPRSPSKDVLFHDVLLVGRDGPVRAHRVVLGAACDLLKTCLLDPFQDLDQDPVILLPDYSSAQIRAFLDVVYGREEVFDQGEVGELMRDCCFRWLRDVKGEAIVRELASKHEEEVFFSSTKVVKKEASAAVMFREEKVQTAGMEEDTSFAEASFDDSQESFDDEFESDEDFVANDEEDEEDDDDDDDSSYEAPSTSEVRKRGRGRPKGSVKKNDAFDLKQQRRKKAYNPDPENPANFLCPEEGCDFSHSKRFAITSHYNIVHNKVDCPHCEKRLCRTTLSSHIARKHTKNPTRQCEHCSKMFYSKHELEVHRNKGHGIATDHIICESCGKDFSSRDVYRRHQYRCQKAEGSTKDRVPYACKLNPSDPTVCPADGCNFKNKSSTAIKKHYRIKHERQICPHCGREYTYYGMKEHIAKEHTKDLKFECDVCSEKFFNEGYLREHKEREHIRELLYMCDKCGKGFFSRKLVARHKNEVHNQDKHNPCPLCPVVYKNRKSLRNHMTSTHHTKLAPKQR